jgi:hypothetical protein
MSRARTIDSLSMFASDDEIAVIVMGPGKASEWRQVVTLLEPRGFPKLDAMMGGRYVPAVKHYFDNEYKLTAGPAVGVPDGPEELGACKPKRRTLRG